MLKYPCQRAMLKSVTVMRDGKSVRMECKATDFNIKMDQSRMNRMPTDEEIEEVILRYCRDCNFEEEFE